MRTLLVAALGFYLNLAAAAEQSPVPVGPPAPQTITRLIERPSVSAPSAHFSGSVRVDPLTPNNKDISAASAYVTFAPGAHSAWHTHPKGQFLIVIQGAGLTQEWGKPVQRIQVGDVVWCPPGVKHWHGATPSSSMTHLAITGNENGKSVDWLEKVEDEQYNAP